MEFMGTSQVGSISVPSRRFFRIALRAPRARPSRAAWARNIDAESSAMRPSSMTSTRSARATASATSCVTRIAVKP